ncbi:aldehyde dehydrogenase family protein [Variovorax sp. J31P207]|uniref:aldehyde dehydrogenase family protein n=1 Tax=Variovorax sp. J31P207 TaxID=3053510 RepID=UPI00336570AA
MVGIHSGVIRTALAPFGGIKQSGMGREGSKCGIEGYMHTKYLCFGGASNPINRSLLTSSDAAICF